MFGVQARACPWGSSGEPCVEESVVLPGEHRIVFVFLIPVSLEDSFLSATLSESLKAFRPLLIHLR